VSATTPHKMSLPSAYKGPPISLPFPNNFLTFPPRFSTPQVLTGRKLQDAIKSANKIAKGTVVCGSEIEPGR